MGSKEDLDIDDDFSDLYKEYTGPMGSKENTTTTQVITTTNKRSLHGSDEEEDTRDPNAVPTDFTSREAKVWEAKSKATERNWKKRKEEEMICKICGESGHFTQGCPSTLGASRKSQDFFERVPAREPHVKALFTEKVVSQLEEDIDCKIKIEEKFIIVSGKDRLILKKGVDAVHKIKEEGEKKGGSSSSQLSRSRSPARRSPVSSRFGRSESQRSNTSPQGASQFQNRFGRQNKVVDDNVCQDLQKLCRGSPQAYGNDGTRGRSSHSRSPARHPYQSNAYNSYDGHSQGRGVYRTEGWDAERRVSDVHLGRKFDYHAFPLTVEELELECKKEAMDLARMRDKEEDEENYRHREAVREIRENYVKKLAILRETHAKQWEEFLQHDAQKRQQQVQQQMSAAVSGGYKPSSYPEYENFAGNPHYSGPNLPMDSRGRYPNTMENYPTLRPHNTYGDFQRQRRDDYGKAYNRY